MQSALESNNTRHKVKKLSVFSSDGELQKFLENNFTESIKQLIRVVVRTMIRDEMENYRKQVDEKLQFNGYYDRTMTSNFGKVEDIPVPRFRQGNEGLPLQSMQTFEDEEHKFMHLIEQMHLLGISQRKIKYLMQFCFKVNVSTDRVGAVYKELAENESLQINKATLGDEFEYLYLDGIWQKTKSYGWTESNDSVILCALGVRPDGSRKIIGFLLARDEDNESWSTLVGGLQQRGLTGDNLKLIVVDDHPSIKHAAGIVYPQVPLQNCLAHKMRNVIAKTSHKNKTHIATDLKALTACQTKDEAMNTAKDIVKKWYQIEPKATESLRHNIEYCFTYYSFPKDIWHKIRTTNILERELREVRRRIKVMDNTFQNEQSANKYANSIFHYLNNHYPRKGGVSGNYLHTKA